MDKFFLYLLESGICLSLFYIGYVLLFRKETYFTFNRIYLLLSITLSIGIPLVHLGLTLKPEAPLVKQVENIKKFKNYYEKLIYLTDPELGMQNTVKHSNSSLDSKNKIIGNLAIASQKNKELWFRVLFWVYVTGVFFFLIRFFYLFLWLYRFSLKHEKSFLQGLHLIQVNDKVPSFSFFNYVFINKNLVTTAELEQVIAHEKIHAKQKHSIDLLIAQAMTIFQWFNPLVWRIRKSMKTIHEYLADREVLQQGYELFDYQSLLLSQLISIRSVELVNNFNLLSIKKRIAMMNKIKSGFLAKLKALFAIPIITIVFLLFADLSLDKTISSSANNDPVTISGVWKSLENKVSVVQIIKFEGKKLITIKVVKENSMIVKDYSLKIERNRLVLNPGKNELKLKYELSGDRLTVWWDDNTSMEYLKSPENINYRIVGTDFVTIKRPKASSYKDLDMSRVNIKISYDKKDFYINEKKCTELSIAAVLKEEKDKCPDKNNIMATLDIQFDAKMKEVNKIIKALRENNILKIAYLTESSGHKTKPGNDFGIARLLPPLDKDIELIDLSELKKQGIKLYKIDISSTIPNIEKTKSELMNFIKSSGKYMMKMMYSDNTSYNSFIMFNDMVNNAFNEIRNEYAKSMYQQNFANLPKEKQNEIKKIYPMTLTTEKK